MQDRNVLNLEIKFNDISTPLNVITAPLAVEGIIA
jgi:hypothetical protein